MLRYVTIIPPEMFDLDPQSFHFKHELRSWVMKNIPKDGDYIFKGKVRPPENDDWLHLELGTWKKREMEYVLSWQEIENMIEKDKSP